MKEIDCTVSGKVQGVGYRIFVKKRADELRLYGYISNEENGEVSVVAQGEEEKLKEFITHLEKGPHFARVDGIKVTWPENLQDSLTLFEII
ncbi:MAG: acylphosphatase [Candidatus Pacebacteria bacterium]|nr:acylphosphatase [Candidatus Paceibacterota bacterium]